MTHRINVWYRYIYLHLVDFYGKCRYIDIPYMDPMGDGIVAYWPYWFLFGTHPL